MTFTAVSAGPLTWYQSGIGAVDGSCDEADTRISDDPRARTAGVGRARVCSAHGTVSCSRRWSCTPDVRSCPIGWNALWGAEPPPSWAKVVQGSIMRLRRTLGPTTVETTCDGYRLAVDGDDIDATAFEHLVARARCLGDLGDHERAVTTLEKGLALSHGRPFGDLDGWEPAQAEAARLESMRHAAEEAMLDAGSSRGAISPRWRRAKRWWPLNRSASGGGHCWRGPVPLRPSRRCTPDRSASPASAGGRARRGAAGPELAALEPTACPAGP